MVPGGVRVGWLQVGEELGGTSRFLAGFGGGRVVPGGVRVGWLQVGEELGGASRFLAGFGGGRVVPGGGRVEGGVAVTDWNNNYCDVVVVILTAPSSSSLYLQMSLQLAHYRLHQCYVLTYESATTRLFFNGRTETIRPVSDHSCAFVQAMQDTTIPREQVKALLKAAIK